MSMKSPKRSIVKNGLFSYFITLFFLRGCEDRETELGPSRGVEGNVLVAGCMDDSYVALSQLSLV